MSEPILEVRNLTVEYTSGKSIVQAVNNLSFTLEKGEALGLVGRFRTRIEYIDRRNRGGKDHDGTFDHAAHYFSTRQD